MIDKNAALAGIYFLFMILFTIIYDETGNIYATIGAIISLAHGFIILIRNRIDKWSKK